MSDITTIGVAMETSGVERGIKTLDELASRGPKVEKAMQGVADASTKASSAASKIGTGAAGMDAFANKGQNASRSMDGLGKAADKAARSTDGLGKNLREAGDGADRASGAARALGGSLNFLVGLAGGLAGALSAKAFIDVADAMSLLDARLKLSTSSTQEFQAAQAALFQVAQQNAVGIAETTTLYTKLADPVKAMGGGMNEVIGITNTFQQALRLSGASAAEAAAATLQFGQALASGVLQGDEFKSLAETAPKLMKTMAEGMGVPIGKLKELGSEGKLTAEAVSNALLKMSGSVAAEFAALPNTVGAEMTRLENDVKSAIQRLNDESQLTLGVAGLVEEVRNLIPAIEGELAGAFAAVGGFIDENRAGLTQVWDLITGIIGDVWEIGKGIGELVGATTQWAIESGTAKTVLESVRMILAGLQDGARILGATFAGVGSTIVRAVLAPLQAMLNGLANAQSALDIGDGGAKLRGMADAMRNFGSAAKEGQSYAAGVFQEFADGKTKLQALGDSLAKVPTYFDGWDTRPITATTEGFKSLNAAAGKAADGTKKAGKAAKEAKDHFADLADKLINESVGLNGDYQKQLDALFKQYSSGALSVDKYVSAVEQLIQKQPFAKKLTKEHADTLKEQKKAAEEAAKAYFDLQKAEGEKLSNTLEEIEREREKQATYGLTESAIRLLEAARLDEAAATQEQLAMMAADKAGNEDAVQKLRERAAALRVLAAEKRKTDAVIRDSEAIKAWADTFRDVDSAMRDVFVNMTDDIGGSFDRLWKSIKAGFMSMLYQLTLQRWIINIGASLTGSSVETFAGLMGVNPNGGIGGIISNLSSGQSLWSAVSGNNPILNAVSSWLGLGGSGTLGAGQGVLAAGMPGAASAWTGLGAGQGVYTSAAWGELAGAGGSSASGAGLSAAAAGGMMAGGLFAAAMLAAEYFLDGRPEYAGFASASTDASRDAAGVSRDAAGITDLVNAHQPPPGSMHDYGNGIMGRIGDIDLPTGAGDLAAAIGITTMPGTGQGISTSNMRGLANLGVMDWYEGAGYVDPGSLGKWDTVYNAEWIRMSRTLAEGVLSSITRAASLAGQQVDLSVIAGMYDDGKKDNIFGYLNVMNGDQSLVNWDEKVGDGQEFLRGIASATLDAFDALDLPRWADGQVAATREAIDKLDADELGDKLGSTALAALDKLNAELAHTAAVLTQLGKTVLEFGGYSTDVIYDITQLMGGVDQFGSAYSAYVSAFYSEEEQLAMLRRQLADQFAALGVAMPDSIAGFRALVESLDLNDAASQKLFASLLAISPEFAKLINALNATGDATDEAAEKAKAAAEAAKALADAYNTAKGNTDGSLAKYESNQQKLVDHWSTVQEAAQNVADEARGIFDLLHQNVRELYGSVSSTQAMQADQGNAFIAAALAAARATGVLPDPDGLSDAISGARGRLTSNRFATREEYEAAQLILAGKMEELEGYADSQLTEAERQAKFAQDQIDLINREIEVAREQVAAIREGNQYLGTIAELTEMIRKEYEAKEAAAKAASTSQTGGRSGGVTGADGPTFGDTSGREVPRYETRDDAESALRKLRAEGKTAWARQAGGGAWEVFETTVSDWTGGLTGLIESGASGEDVLAAAVGKTVQQLARAMGILDDKAMESWLKSQGFSVGVGGYIGAQKSFAVGTNFVPYDMVAQIHKGERIIPAADNSALMQAVQKQNAQSDTSDLRTGFNALASENVAIKNQLKRSNAALEAIVHLQQRILEKQG